MKQLANPWEKVFSERLPQALKRFAKISEMILQSFYKGIISRALQSGASVTRVAMLGQQVRNYQAVFVDLADDMLKDINAHQREANREFAPVIAEKLASAYEKCAAETGKPIQKCPAHTPVIYCSRRRTVYAHEKPYDDPSRELPLHDVR
jgi:hypothetical protein